MEKHISHIDGIKCNIEIAKQSGEMYNVKGWVFNDKDILEEIQIVSGSHLQVHQLTSRPDVSTY